MRVHDGSTAEQLRGLQRSRGGCGTCSVPGQRIRLKSKSSNDSTRVRAKILPLQAQHTLHAKHE